MTDTAVKEKKQLNIPPEVMERFPEVIELIKNSQSMDNEERQYWIDALPVMTGEQLENLRGILTNEKDQIKEANTTYEKSAQKEIKKSELDFNEATYKAKEDLIHKAEAANEKVEEFEEEGILKELDNM